MSWVIDLMQQGGPVMYLVLALAILGSGMPLVCALLGTRFRVPTLLWVGAPLATILVGLAGTCHGLALAADALAWASPETVGTLVHAGYSMALLTTLTALAVAAALLLESSWLAALISVLRPGSPARFSALPLLVFLGPLVAAPCLIVWSLFEEQPPLVGLILLLVSPALALNALRVGETPEGRLQQSAARSAAAFSAIGAVLCVALAGLVQGTIMVHDALALASPESMSALVWRGLTFKHLSWVTGAIGVAVISVAAALSCSSVFRSLLSLRTVVEGGLFLVWLLCAGLAQGFIELSYGGFTAHWAAYQLEGLDEAIPDLPVDRDFQGEPQYSTRAEGFERVLMLSAEEPTDSWERWERGTRTPSTLTLEGGTPVLVAVPAQTPALMLATTPWAPDTIDLLILTHYPDAPPTQFSGGLWLDAMAFHQTRFEWLALSNGKVPHSKDTDMLVISEIVNGSTLALMATDDGLGLYTEKGPVMTGTDLSTAVSAMEGELMSRPEILRVALFPGPTWTVQDLVGICNSARRVREESWEPAPTCALLSEPPAVLVGNDG